MKRPIIFVVTAAMAMTVGACNNADDDSASDNDQELPAETDEETDDSENETEEEGTAEDDIEEENEDGTATEEVDFLFYDEEALNMYRETRTVTAASTEELPASAVEEWLSGPENDELTSLTDEGVDVQYVDDQDSIAHISFSPEITDANFGSSAETAFLDQVAHIMAQFGYDSTQFLLDGEIQESLFGHIDTSEPYTPDDSLDTYDEINE
ncbi:GerMN domain-containing protein [Salicibibacter cibi]|uniref:GerMN domain-containing protein n=1 Tax=Salicibibacter cibi TaxID=2743001 RepID=A0A7T6ZA19_9BACI|nr:GerMN domain-containing protein [Salicibibacter cibi]QQK79166.1 GerMN domain-containing protein [Salicibibacter cibi]